MVLEVNTAFLWSPAAVINWFVYERFLCMRRECRAVKAWHLMVDERCAAGQNCQNPLSCRSALQAEYSSCLEVYSWPHRYNTLRHHGQFTWRVGIIPTDISSSLQRQQYFVFFKPQFNRWICSFLFMAQIPHILELCCKNSAKIVCKLLRNGFN